MRKLHFLAFLTTALVAAGTAPAASAASAPAAATGAGAVSGVWVTDGGKSHVRIYRGDDGKYYGRIVWLKNPDFPADFSNKALAGKPKVDYRNPDKSRRDQPLMGMVVLKNFSYQTAKDNWKGNYCYNPDEGKKSGNCLLWLSDHGDKLHVRGYLGIFWETHTWERVSGPAAAASGPAIGAPAAGSGG